MHLHILPSVALLSQDRAAIQPRQQQAKPARTDFDLCCHAAAHSLSLLLLKSLHLLGPCRYIDYYSFTDPRGMEGRVG